MLSPTACSIRARLTGSAGLPMAPFRDLTDLVPGTNSYEP
jgi:hypothetical protein